MMSDFDGDIDLVTVYYNRIFPLDPIKTWLTYDNASNLSHREFSYILADNTFIRYEAFTSNLQFASFIRRKQPLQILLGAVYNASPAKKAKVIRFTPNQKEIIFDLDLTSYDDVRTCCSGKQMCKKCWIFMKIATKVLDALLRTDFGFKDLLWVFSGRRGVHCIVCDQSARVYSSRARQALLGFANVVREQTKVKMVTLLGNQMHSSIKRALTIIEPYLNRIIEDQDLLGTAERVAAFVEIFEDASVRNHVQISLLAELTPLARWNKFVEIARSSICRDFGRKYMFVVEEYILQIAYPRFDCQVTIQLAHLYKSPFSIHHANGKIAVPYDPNLVEEFDPFAVPSLKSLETEFNTNYQPNERPVGKLYMYTSLCKYVTYFEQWLSGVMARNNYQSKLENKETPSIR